MIKEDKSEPGNIMCQCTHVRWIKGDVCTDCGKLVRIKKI